MTTDNNKTTLEAKFIINKMSSIGYYISIQGNIGGGKSTLLKYIEEYIKENKLSAIEDYSSSSSSYNDNHLNNGTYHYLTHNNLYVQDDCIIINPFYIKEEKDYFIIIDEPIEEWKKEIYTTNLYNENIKDFEKTNMLNYFYKDMSRNGFLFQVHAFTTRLQKILNKMNEIKNGKKGKIHIIAERSLRTDRLFFLNLYESNLITKIEFDIYDSFFNLICNEIIKKENIMIYIKTPPEKCNTRINKRDRKEEINGICPDYLISLDEQHDRMVNQFEQNLNNKVIRLNFEKDFLDDEFKNLTKNLMNELLNEINK